MKLLTSQSLECDTSFYDKPKNRQNKTNYKKYLLLIFFILLIFGIIFFIILIFKKEKTYEPNFQNIYNKLKEMENKIFEENELLKNEINEINIQNKELKKNEIKIFEENELLKNEINDINTQNKELKKNEDKIFEENALLKNEINDINTQNKELKKNEDKIFEENALLKNEINDINLQNQELKKMEGQLLEENNLLKNQINEINLQNKELKELISQKDIKIQSGEYFVDFYSSDIKYMMDSIGWRTFTQHINFDEKYEKNPRVMVSINQLDNNKNKNLRINVFPENIDISGFDITISTWDDTSIYSVRIDWISFY